jgi:hypothetical protein
MQSNTALQINNYTLVGVVDLSCLQQGQAHSVLSVLLCRLNGMFSELCWPRRWFACLLGSADAVGLAYDSSAELLATTTGSASDLSYMTMKAVQPTLWVCGSLLKLLEPV